MENFTFQEKIKYQIQKNKKDNITEVKIFNEKFVEMNESNFKIIYNEREMGLKSSLEISNDITSNIVEIELKQINQITNLSNMFYECKSLYSFPGLSKLNIDNVTNLSSLFRNCINIRKLPDISKWNTSNVNNMSYLFSGCNCLFSIPDISKWETSKVINFSFMFMGCKNIFELPDISKWKTSQCTKMTNMFQGCTLLKQLPDISRWDVGAVTNMSYMFYDCKSLSCLPDISIWDIKKVEDMSSMFYQCEGLNSLPNLNKWKISSLKKYTFMFVNCKPTLNYPSFSKYSSHALNFINNNSIPSAKTQNNKSLEQMNFFQHLNAESLDQSYSKNYLCCPNCKGIPEFFLKKDGIAVLFCDFCGSQENVKVCDILNNSSKWINRIFYRCNWKKGHEQKY